MVCSECQIAQDNYALWAQKGEPEPRSFYVRVGISNVQFIACENHMREVIDTLKKGRKDGAN